jgi:hypothetical protein
LCDAKVQRNEGFMVVEREMTGLKGGLVLAALLMLPPPGGALAH